MTDSTGNDGTKAVKIMLPLKYWIYFCRTLEMPLINCEINLLLTCSKNFIISNAAANWRKKIAITDTKLEIFK